MSEEEGAVQLANAVLAEAADRVLDSHCIKCGRPVAEMTAFYMRGDGQIQCGVFMECNEPPRARRKPNPLT